MAAERDPDVQFKSGGGQIARATPGLVKEQGKAKENILRMWVAGVVLTGLLVALGCALVWRPEHVQGILAALGTIAGFLLGPRPATTPS